MILIIDYGLGNLLSVANALKFISKKAIVSNKKEDFQRAQKFILPGVGAFSKGMDNLKKAGLVEILHEEVLVKKKPILGICLGLQLFAQKSYEGGIYKGLGWIEDSSVERITPKDKALKVPHVGWDEIKYKKEDLFEGVDRNPAFYFVHSYHMVCGKDHITSTFNYGGTWTASIQKENIYGTQFHPEKSQNNGLRLLKNFADL